MFIDFLFILFRILLKFYVSKHNSNEIDKNFVVDIKLVVILMNFYKIFTSDDLKDFEGNF